jgi:D-arginine dehydrogenase
MTSHYDIAVIGAGIAGVSVAAHLAVGARVAVIEQESHAGYHSTGRSVALFSETYGSPTVRALSRLSRAFFMTPPDGFTDVALLKRRGELLIAAHDQRDALDAHWTSLAGALQRLEPDQARALCPLLSKTYVVGALYDPETYDIDVHALHLGYIRLFQARGGHLATDSRVVELRRRGRRWHINAAAGQLTADVVINAAGAWADDVAALSGAAPIGLQPKKRTALLVDPPQGHNIEHWPIVGDVEEHFYFKPDAGLLLLSPCDESAVAPGDVQPDELDIAVAIDRVEKATTLSVRHVRRKWAGLRNFVADREPAVGYDAGVEGFFWLAGQGGYGLQTAPALSRLAAAMVQHTDPAEAELAALAGVLSPQRSSLERKAS